MGDDIGWYEIVVGDVDDCFLFFFIGKLLGKCMRILVKYVLGNWECFVLGGIVYCGFFRLFGDFGNGVGDVGDCGCEDCFVFGVNDDLGGEFVFGGFGIGVD